MKPKKLLALTFLPVLVLASCTPEVLPDNFYRFNDKAVTTTLRQARKGTYQSDSPTIGDSRVLVVPVEFADFLPAVYCAEPKVPVKILKKSILASLKTRNGNL